jgi:drug/metabolite transporter (DMT)-like permease
MTKSYLCFFIAAIIGLSAWFVNMNSIPTAIAVSVLVTMLFLGALGFYFWAHESASE